MAVRHVWLIAVLTLRCSAYELTGRIEPPAALPISLYGATFPFESSTESNADGRFHFHKISAGTYTLAVSTKVSGQALETIELGPGTVDSKGRFDIVLTTDEKRPESEGAHGTSATVSATVLSIPERAVASVRKRSAAFPAANRTARQNIFRPRFRWPRNSPRHGISWALWRTRPAASAKRRRTSAERLPPILRAFGIHRRVQSHRLCRRSDLSRFHLWCCEWGGPPGLQPTPSSASSGVVECGRAGPGIRPTTCVGRLFKSRN
jgi:hypothetical protein